MSRGGVGRGRGWLNLYKNNSTQPVSPGPIQDSTLNNSKIISSAINDSASHVDSNEYADLILKVKHLSVQDDGILFNQKIKYVVENWEEYCTNGEEVEKSFDMLHQASLYDPELATKLVIMIASRTFINQEVRNQNIRLMFLRKLQDNFENSKHLQGTNPNAFRNSVQMLGEFYNKARLANGQQLTFMAPSLVASLEMLLASAQQEDLKVFATQLNLNGASLRNECQDNVSDILMTVRRLITDKVNDKESRLWLLLSLDVANNRFGLLPPELHTFYQLELGDIAMASFQGSHGTLSVQTTHTSQTLENYKSNVNVLQVSTASESSSEQNSSSTNTSCTSNNVDYNNYNTSDLQNTSTNKSMKQGGRPILGAGARFQKKSNNDQGGVTNWRDHGKDNGGWSNKSKNSAGWNDNKRQAAASKSKGWEHDDRFETDYS